MRIYENAHLSTYDEFKTWYPVWYQEIREMDAIWKTMGAQMDDIQASLIRLVDNNFIEFADAPTLTKFEEAFDVTHSIPRTLAERRAIILGFIRGRGSLGRPQIIDLLALFTQGVVRVEFIRPGFINVVVTRDFDDPFKPSDIHLILDGRIPAHLTLFVTDSPLPVRLVNQNRFSLNSLLMFNFAIRNITAPRLLDDGPTLLDGTWLLNGLNSLTQGPILLTHGIGFPEFQVALTVRNSQRLAAQDVAFGTYRLQNANNLGSSVLIKAESWVLDGGQHLDATRPLGPISTKGVI